MNGMREGTVTLNGDLRMAELDQAALKEGINAYLKQWILVIGLVNIVVIASSIGYVFFFLPKTVASEAIGILERIDENQRKRVFEIVGQALVQAGESKERAKKAIEDATKSEVDVTNLAARVHDLQEVVKQVSNENAVRVGEAAKALKTDENVAKAIELSGRVLTLETTLNEKPLIGLAIRLYESPDGFKEHVAGSPDVYSLARCQLPQFEKLVGGAHR